MKLIIPSAMDLFTLRCAAGMWLREHPEDPNAPTVRKALLNTQDEDPHSAEVSNA